MKLWRGQPDYWRPQALPRGRHIAAWLCLSAIFVYLALQSVVDPAACHARSFTCMAAASWAAVAGISPASALARVYGVLALIFGILAFVSAPPKRRNADEG